MEKSLQELLEDLAELTVGELYTLIKSGKADVGHFAVARALLKDNNITAGTMAEGNLTKLGKLISLPTIPDDTLTPN